MNLYGFVKNDGVNKLDYLGMHDCSAPDCCSLKGKCTPCSSISGKTSICDCISSQIVKRSSKRHWSWNPLLGFGWYTYPELILPNPATEKITPPLSSKKRRYVIQTWWKNSPKCRCVKKCGKKDLRISVTINGSPLNQSVGGLGNQMLPSHRAHKVTAIVKAGGKECRRHEITFTR